MYSDTGGSGPPVVFLHGVLMNGTLWNDIVDQLCDRYRCIVPELPFGARRTPMPDDADLRLESLVKMGANFLAELGLRADGPDRADPVFQPVTAQRTLRGDVTPHSPWLDPSRGPIAAIASISTSIPG